jgi:hypothetical protein
MRAREFAVKLHNMRFEKCEGDCSFIEQATTVFEEAMASQPSFGDSVTKESIRTVTFWLVNILRELDDEKIRLLIQQLNERLVCLKRGETFTM